MLRRKLQEMIDRQAEVKVSHHPLLLDALTRECPNAIRLLESPHPVERYTCLMYVLDFTEKPEYIAIAARGLQRVYAGPAFAHWLLDQGFLDELSPSTAREGDLVFYFDDDGRFTHAGLWVGNQRVVSKWGLGHLYEHGLFELPESYGTNVRFFKRLPYDKAYDLFKRFARENGVML